MFQTQATSPIMSYFFLFYPSPSFLCFHLSLHMSLVCHLRQGLARTWVFCHLSSAAVLIDSGPWEVYTHTPLLSPLSALKPWSSTRSATVFWALLKSDWMNGVACMWCSQSPSVAHAKQSAVGLGLPALSDNWRMVAECSDYRFLILIL